jgi:hypothetical protein
MVVPTLIISASTLKIFKKYLFINVRILHLIFLLVYLVLDPII